jgi:hypothetical protein
VHRSVQAGAENFVWRVTKSVEEPFVIFGISSGRTDSRKFPKGSCETLRVIESRRGVRKPSCSSQRGSNSGGQGRRSESQRV